MTGLAISLELKLHIKWQYHLGADLTVENIRHRSHISQNNSLGCTAPEYELWYASMTISPSHIISVPTC